MKKNLEENLEIEQEMFSVCKLSTDVIYLNKYFHAQLLNNND